MAAQKRIFVVSPLRAANGRTQEQNERLAERLARAVALSGHAPLPPHILFTRFLDEAVPAERDLGISCGLTWLEVSDEVWVYDMLGISGGMRGEIAFARSIGIKVVVQPEVFKSVLP